MLDAVIDIGSNTVRMSVYRQRGGNGELVLSEKESVGLAGYIKNGVLSEEGIQKACEALGRFRELLDAFQIAGRHAFATAPLRGIENAPRAKEAIERAGGIPIAVLTGEQEAKLAFLGVRGEFDAQEGIVMDMGGGSTELAVFSGGELTDCASVPLGSLVLHRRHGGDLFPNGEQARAIRLAVGEGLRDAKLKPSSGETLCGVGGTIRAALKVYNEQYAKEKGNRVMKARALERMVNSLLLKERETVKLLSNTAPDRILTLLPGLCGVCEIADFFSVERIVVCKGGVREGFYYREVRRQEN